MKIASVKIDDKSKGEIKESKNKWKTKYASCSITITGKKYWGICFGNDIGQFDLLEPGKESILVFYNEIYEGKSSVKFRFPKTEDLILYELMKIRELLFTKK